MSKKKIAAAFVTVLVCVVLNVLIMRRHEVREAATVNMTVELNDEASGNFQLFYKGNSESEFSEEKKSEDELQAGKLDLNFALAENEHFLRLDFPDEKAEYVIKKITFRYQDIEVEYPLENLAFSAGPGIESLSWDDASKQVIVKTTETDPFITFEIADTGVSATITAHDRKIDNVKNILVCLALDIIVLGTLIMWNKIAILPKELYGNRRLIIKLAKNDFKTRYAGSYLGIVWAFIQPIVTVVVYWFVFQVGLRNGNVGNFPFVLWLIAGLVPWFFFSEAWNSGTNALIEYSYLVKKVVFKISILPVIKVLSALFVHLFFILFTLVLYSCYGYFPDIYTLQVFYYTACMIILTLALSYMTSALVIFFRDLTQIISIILQVGVWMTPIMWQITMVPEKFRFLFEINPMYYIVCGYRDALINKVWFWDNFYTTAWFWSITLFLFAVGTLIFKRLKVHFADIL